VLEVALKKPSVMGVGAARDPDFEGIWEEARFRALWQVSPARNEQGHHILTYDGLLVKSFYNHMFFCNFMDREVRLPLAFTLRFLSKLLPNF
jgi:hypothetical protein